MTAARGKLAFLLPNMRGGGAERVALRLMEDFVAQGHPVDLLLMTAEGELMPLLPPAVRVVDLRAPRPGRRAVRAVAHRLDDPGGFAAALNRALATLRERRA